MGFIIPGLTLKNRYVIIFDHICGYEVFTPFLENASLDHPVFSAPRGISTRVSPTAVTSDFAFLCLALFECWRDPGPVRQSKCHHVGCPTHFLSGHFPIPNMEGNCFLSSRNAMTIPYSWAPSLQLEIGADASIFLDWYDWSLDGRFPKMGGVPENGRFIVDTPKIWMTGDTTSSGLISDRDPGGFLNGG